MYLGNVCYNSNVVDAVEVVGRVSSAAAVVFPTKAPRFTVTAGATGVYNIVFVEQFVSFGGAVITPELAAMPGSTAATPEVSYNWTAATRTLQVLIAKGSDGTGLAAAFSFRALFSDSSAF
jgi:hypothetical protein